jgi:hypothetical protein
MHNEQAGCLASSIRILMAKCTWFGKAVSMMIDFYVDFKVHLHLEYRVLVE